MAILVLSSPAYATSFTHSDSKFNTDSSMSTIQSIESWEQPKLSGTPKNLTSEKQVRVNGRGTNGQSSYTLHFTDYDTYITDSFVKDGKYYVKDNLGRTYLTGKDGGLTEVQQKQLQQVDVNTKQIQANTTSISNMNTRMNAYDTRLNNLDKRVDKIQDRMESGFATMAALSGLHPNPRAKGKTQVAVSGGLYRDNVAGAIGIFHNFKDNVMLSVGAAYGGDESWAGNVGLTFSW